MTDGPGGPKDSSTAVNENETAARPIRIAIWSTTKCVSFCIAFETVNCHSHEASPCAGQDGQRSAKGARASRGPLTVKPWPYFLHEAMAAFRSQALFARPTQAN